MPDVFSHPWLGGLFGDGEVETLLSAETVLNNMLAVEAAYTRALGNVGQAEPQAVDAVLASLAAFSPDFPKLAKGTLNDGVVLPSLVKEIRKTISEAHHSALHKGMTSQDVIDTALVLTLKPIFALMRSRLDEAVHAIDQLITEYGENALMGRTRMQAALTISVKDRMNSWKRPLLQNQSRLEQLKPSILCIQLGGAVGDRKAFGLDGDEIAAYMADELSLSNPTNCWHTDRSTIAEFASWLSLTTGALGKIGQDVTLMSQQGISEIQLAGGGGSSAMPHKQNPVQAELLETIARFNATQLSGIHQALVHEQERSGAAWMLEWMILPQMIVATGKALSVVQTTLTGVDSLGH